MNSSVNRSGFAPFNRLAFFSALAAFTPAVTFAQTKDASADAASLRMYDLNKNGRLDSDEETAMRAAEARAAKAPIAPVAEKGDTVLLSPFEVKEANNGYYASNTMSGTRLNTKVEDLASSISVVTKQQMSDFAMLDINDIFDYEAGTEGTGNYTSYDVNRKGQVADAVQANPQGSNRVRGIGPANMTLDGFATSGRVPVDPLSLEAVEISRGPNSNIFGLGEGSGTVNMVAASANLNRTFSQTQLRFDDIGGWRTSFDFNRPLIHNKLSARVSAVYQHDEFRRKPSEYNTRRLNAMIRAQPFRSTVLRASFQSYFADGSRATTMTPRDGVTDWIRNGSPTWDPITSTVTVKGVSSVMGTANPQSLADQARSSPVLFVDRGGIQLWEIGRMPAATATNGPNNVGGTQRILETVPEPVRDGHPLFSTLSAVSDRSLYDYSSINLGGPNYSRDEVSTSTVEFEQYLFDTGKHTAAFQFAWQREDADRLSRNVIGSVNPVGTSFYLYIDPNSRLLDGSTNPYYLRPYIGAAESVPTRTPYVRDSYRGQLAYIVDFAKDQTRWTKWIGRHQFLGYYEERKSKSYLYRFRDAMLSDNPVYAPAGQPKGNQSGTPGQGFPASPAATRGYYHYYVGDNQGNNVDYGPSRAEAGNYTFNWYDPRAGKWVADPAVMGESGITEGTAGSGSSLNLIKTKGAMMQNNFLGGGLVTTFGVREDENRNKNQKPAALKSNGYEFDYERMDGWVGDWAFRAGKTQTAGAVARPFQGWAFTEHARAGTGWQSAAANVLSGLRVFYNQSNSFKPELPGYSIQLAEMPNPTSEGKDYGFAINLGSKLAFRANTYSTTVTNSRVGEGTNIANRLLQIDFDGWAASNNAFSLERQARAWTTQLNPGLSSEQVSAAVEKIIGLDADDFRSRRIVDTNDLVAKGEEYELNYNPSSFWTIRANVTRSESIDTRLSANNSAWLDQRTAHWKKIIDPRTGTPWMDTAYAGDFPAAGGAKAGDYIQQTTVILDLERLTEGQTRPQIREWRFNFSTSCRLAGITSNRILRNVAVGGGVRWESRGAIGYYGIPIEGNYDVATKYDPNHPIYDKDHAYFDAFVSYSARLFHNKIRARFQINAKNLQESSARLQAIGAFPNGVAHSFRIIDPRMFIFTTTFDL